MFLSHKDSATFKTLVAVFVLKACEKIAIVPLASTL